MRRRSSLISCGWQQIKAQGIQVSSTQGDIAKRRTVLRIGRSQHPGQLNPQKSCITEGTESNGMPWKELRVFTPSVIQWNKACRHTQSSTGYPETKRGPKDRLKDTDR